LRGCEIQPDISVGKLPLKIDLIIKCHRTSTEPVTIPLLEAQLTQMNLIEYKSSHDIPKKQDLAKLIGYLGLYCDQHHQGVREIITQFTLWYITANRPAFFDTLLKELIITETDVRGLYQLQAPFLCPYLLLVINEVDISEENLPLLLLSSGETLRNTIRLIIQKGGITEPLLEKYLSLAYLINYKDVYEMTEIQSLLPESVKKNIKHAIKDIGVKEVIHLIGLGEVGSDQGSRLRGSDQGSRLRGSDQGSRLRGSDQGSRLRGSY